MRPEVNARQRDAPSGVKVFGYEAVGYSPIIRMATQGAMI